MARKLGETLVDKGIITEPQLKKALDAQLIFGGHLGTCMIEMGLIDERTLGEVLSDLLDVGYAAPHVLEQIPLDVLRLIPKKIAADLQAVPFRFHEQRLHVAMVKPTDLAALDEVAFHSGKQVVPWVSPEIRVFLALEKHYGLPRRRRFIALSCELERLDREGDRDGKPGMIRPVTPFTEAHQVEEEAAEDPAPELITPDAGLDEEYQRPWQEVAAELFQEEGEADALPPDGPAGEDHGTGSIEQLAERMCRASNKEDIASALLDFVRESTPRCILFLVQSTEAEIWDGRGVEIAPETRETLRLQITWEPLFRLLSELSYYVGPLPADVDYDEFYDRLGLEKPEQVLLWPVYLEDRLVAILYGDGGAGQSLSIDPRVFSRVIQKLALALKLVIIKKKIQSA
jgi:hypothetical protein